MLETAAYAPLGPDEIAYLRGMTPHSNTPYYSTKRWTTTVTSMSELLNEARGLLATFVLVSEGGNEHSQRDINAARDTIDRITERIGFLS